MTIGHQGQTSGISIHALRKESDELVLSNDYDYVISIHALRKESDPYFPTFIDCRVYFNPRSP